MQVTRALVLNTILVVAIVLAAIGGVVIVLRDTGRDGAIEIELPEPTVIAPSATAPTVTIKVYVSGEVNQPGVYELADEARADEALRVAGGPTSNADLNRVNLAKRLADEEQLHIPGRGEPQSDASPAAPGDSPGSQIIDLNTATAEQLQTLPNIGPTRAQAIIGFRNSNGPFEEVEDLRQIGGIGSATLESIRDLVEVR